MRRYYGKFKIVAQREFSIGKELLRFEFAGLKRRWRYKNLAKRVHSRQAVVHKLRTDGCAIIKGCFDKALLFKLSREMEPFLETGKGLTRVSKDSARKTGDLGSASSYLSEEELAKGQAFYREHTNYVSIADPLINCPTSVQLAFNDLLIDIATDYLGCVPGIGGLNLRKSFVNQLPEFDTHYFHSDGNSRRFLKFFFYLNDVDERGGPFCYVSGSHKQKFKGWSNKYRWLPTEIEAIYEKESIVYLTADVGDMIVADTTGFHRGTKVQDRDRSMLTVNYVLHPEYWDPTPQFKVTSEVFKNFTPKQRAAADFVEVIPG